LLEIKPSGGFFHPPAANELREKLAAGGEFHDEVDFGFGGHDFVEFKDVGVVEAAHGVDFTEETWLVGGGGFFDDFDGDGGVVGEGTAVVDFGEAAAA